MREFLERSHANRVIDTTGSVVYLSNTAKQLLKNRALIIYLEANQEAYDQLFEVYLTDPKPIIWGENFNKQENETKHEALKRCYPGLIRYRANKYQEWADITIPYEIARNTQSSAQEFLQEIVTSLP